jgi:CHAT domain-containing protein
LRSGKGPFLIEERAVAIAPSAALYVLALERDRERSLQSAGDVLVVGSPVVDAKEHPSLSALPAAEEEARVVARTYRGSRLLVGAEATKAEFLKLVPGAMILHFAGHAVANEDAPFRSRIVLAPATGGEGAGDLYASEIGQLRLPETRLVILSACQTAEGRIWKNEGVESLARPFFAAGVPVVVASLWRVEDVATAELFPELHDQINKGNDPITALRNTQIAMIKSSDESRREPAFWAGFEVIGGASSASPGPWFEQRSRN